MNNTDVRKLFQNELFLKLLDERIQRSSHSGIIKSSDELDISSTKVFASDLISDLSEEINSVIGFNLKTILADGLDNGQIKKQIDILKQTVRKLCSKLSMQTDFQRGCISLRGNFDDEFEESLQQEKVRLEQKNTQSSQLLKLKKEVQALKSNLIRFTCANKELNSPILQANRQKLDESRLGHVAKDINNINASVMNIFDGNSSINLDKHSYLTKQIQSLWETVNTRVQQQSATNDKYQTSFRSIWNVMTIMEGNISETKKQIESKFGSLVQKIQKKGGGYFDKMFK